MSKNRNLDRERLEVILMHILMRFRLYFLIFGMALLVLSTSFTTMRPGLSLVGILIGVLLLLPFFSFKFTIYAAKAGAWIGTVGKRD